MSLLRAKRAQSSASLIKNPHSLELHSRIASLAPTASHGGRASSCALSRRRPSAWSSTNSRDQPRSRSGAESEWQQQPCNGGGTGDQPARMSHHPGSEALAGSSELGYTQDTNNKHLNDKPHAWKLSRVGARRLRTCAPLRRFQVTPNVRQVRRDPGLRTGVSLCLAATVGAGFLVAHW